MNANNTKKIQNILLIFIGTCLYAFGLVFFNIANELAEGGVTGITLILRALFQLNPAYTTLIINIPLILFGGKILGKHSFYYTLVGTISLAFFLWFWQQIPLYINLNHDVLIASLLAGLFAGFGSGIIYRVGGTTGGTDILARMFERKYGISMGRSLLIFDTIVLLLSLTYIDLTQMMYSLIVAFVFSKVVDFVIDGAYAAKGVFIISDHSFLIAETIMSNLGRGVTFFNGTGAYSKNDKQILYLIISPSEVIEIKEIVQTIDFDAFLSIIDVHEVIGEGFSYDKPSKKRFWTQKNNL